MNHGEDRLALPFYPVPHTHVERMDRMRAAYRQDQLQGESDRKVRLRKVFWFSVSGVMAGLLLATGRVLLGG